MHYTVSGISLVAASIEADTTWLSHTGLSWYFEPWAKVKTTKKSKVKLADNHSCNHSLEIMLKSIKIIQVLYHGYISIYITKLWCNHSIQGPCNWTYPIVPSPPHRNPLESIREEMQHNESFLYPYDNVIWIWETIIYGLRVLTVRGTVKPEKSFHNP